MKSNYWRYGSLPFSRDRRDVYTNFQNKNNALRNAVADLEAKNLALSANAQNHSSSFRAQANIRTLEEKISHQNRALEAAKMLHNKLTEKLRQKELLIDNLEMEVDGGGAMGTMSGHENLDKQLKETQEIIARKDVEIENLTEDIENLQARLRLLGTYK